MAIVIICQSFGGRTKIRNEGRRKGTKGRKDNVSRKSQAGVLDFLGPFNQKLVDYNVYSYMMYIYIYIYIYIYMYRVFRNLCS